jgi:hypothetical protein
MSRAAENPNKKAITSFNLPLHLRQRIALEAQKDQRKMSDWIRIHFEQFFNSEDRAMK